jgi:hypothetical protein
MAYDRADWHSGADNFPRDLPAEAGATHIGMFLAWAIVNRLEGEIHRETEQSRDALRAVREREVTGREFLLAQCDSKFWAEDLNDQGNAFADWYYGTGSRSGRYLNDYERALGAGLDSLYRVEDTWASYDRVAAAIDRRYRRWRRHRGRSWFPWPR